MRDLLEMIVEFLGVLLIVVAVAFLSVFSLFNGFYTIAKHFDTSTGVVMCNNQEVYNGRLYRVDRILETENLQAPMFSISIRNADNWFKVEKRMFCKDLIIMEQQYER